MSTLVIFTAGFIAGVTTVIGLIWLGSLCFGAKKADEQIEKFKVR